MSGFERGDDRATMFKRHEDTSKVVQGGLMAVSALLSLGSNLPLVGQLCEAAQGCLDSAEEFKSKAKDVTIAARRVCDVLDIVYLMAQNVDRLEEKALVESRRCGDWWTCSSSSKGSAKVREEGLDEARLEDARPRRWRPPSTRRSCRSSTCSSAPTTSRGTRT